MFNKILNTGLFRGSEPNSGAFLCSNSSLLSSFYRSYFSNKPALNAYKFNTNSEYESSFIFQIMVSIFLWGPLLTNI
jgi:hypothetical protein